MTFDINDIFGFDIAQDYAQKEVDKLISKIEEVCLKNDDGHFLLSYPDYFPGADGGNCLRILYMPNTGSWLQEMTFRIHADKSGVNSIIRALENDERITRKDILEIKRYRVGIK